MPPTTPATATIDELAWISGRWAGERDDDRFEETWSAAEGNVMLGMFRLLRGGEPRFYELLALAAEGGGVVFRFRHFDPALVGWEERDAPLVFDLVAQAADEAVFLRRGAPRWLTYRREAGGGLLVFFSADDEPPASGDTFRFRLA